MVLNSAAVIIDNNASFVEKTPNFKFLSFIIRFSIKTLGVRNEPEKTHR